MFSFIQNIGSLRKPYEADASDAKLQRRRRDEVLDEGQVERYEHSEDHDGDGGQVLSVQAIILFLEDFVMSRLDSRLKSDEGETGDGDFLSPWAKTTASNENDMKEASLAYAKCSKAVRSVRSSSVEDTNLSHVYVLIQDLRDLKALGVTVLRLDGNSDFIANVRAAVDRAQ